MADELVYGLSTAREPTLVVMPESMVREIAADYDALGMASTYGEARALALTHVRAPGVSDEDEDDAPADDAPYDLYATAAAEAGDWPLRAATFALDWVPEELDLGVQVDSFMMVPVLHIDPDTEESMVAAVRAAGYTVQRDDGLIARIDR